MFCFRCWVVKCSPVFWTWVQGSYYIWASCWHWLGPPFWRCQTHCSSSIYRPSWLVRGMARHWGWIYRYRWHTCVLNKWQAALLLETAYRAVKLPWIFPGAPLTSENIQGNLTGMCIVHTLTWCWHCKATLWCSGMVISAFMKGPLVCKLR